MESEPKTEESRRRVPLDGLLVAALRSHRTRQREERLAAGLGRDDGAHVFADELGEPLHPDWISGRFQKLSKAAGLRVVRLHDCRHCAASLMLSSGEQSTRVASILGHSSTRVTEGIYRHLMPGELEETGERHSARLLGGA